ncbi:MAG: hypothetical protein VKL59_16770 [Nostocaceae cyanobacterium]|nr:hypothetical protein [Nostocaceae cyanobacterium]
MARPTSGRMTSADAGDKQMNTLKLKPGDKIGVFFYNDWRGCKVIIEEIADISPQGVVTLKNGTRYNRYGQEVGALGEATHLCTVEKATAIMENRDDASPAEKESDTELDAANKKHNQVAQAAVTAAIKVLNQHGWYGDADGDMDAIASEMEEMIRDYLKEH